MKGLLYRLKGWSIEKISTWPKVSIIVVGVILISIFQCFPFSVKVQEHLNALTIGVIGAILLLIIAELFFGIKNKSSYPTVKAFAFGRVTKVLHNCALKLQHRFDVDSNYTQSSIIIDNCKLINFLDTFSDKSRPKIEEMYLLLPEQEVSDLAYSVAEHLSSLEYTIACVGIIHFRDDDFAIILKVHEILTNIKDELRKTKATREQNKMFFSSYICNLASQLKLSIESGLYDHWVIPQHQTTVMVRHYD
ncbi:MAG: hypothetical protein P9X24_00250 [Candidatus Hatepunaea meridiana]|nr:hypothetical protein [Candidatus Hatepunaea meridiana]